MSLKNMLTTSLSLMALNVSKVIVLLVVSALTILAKAVSASNTPLINSPAIPMIVIVSALVQLPLARDVVNPLLLPVVPTLTIPLVVCVV